MSTAAGGRRPPTACPITNKRISVTPIALVGEPSARRRYVPLAETLDRAGAELGIDYVGGFSAHVEKGCTPGDRVLLDSIPEALATTQRVCSSVNVATTRAGINMDAVARMGAHHQGARRAHRAIAAASAAPSSSSSPTSPTTTRSSPARSTASASASA